MSSSDSLTIAGIPITAEGQAGNERSCYGFSGGWINNAAQADCSVCPIHGAHVRKDRIRHGRPALSRRAAAPAQAEMLQEGLGHALEPKQPTLGQPSQQGAGQATGKSQTCSRQRRQLPECVCRR